MAVICFLWIANLRVSFRTSAPSEEIRNLISESEILDAETDSPEAEGSGTSLTNTKYDQE